MVSNVYVSNAIELEDKEGKKFIVSNLRVKHYNIKNSMVAKVEFVYFKDAKW